MPPTRALFVRAMYRTSARRITSLLPRSCILYGSRGVSRGSPLNTSTPARSSPPPPRPRFGTSACTAQSTTTASALLAVGGVLLGILSTSILDSQATRDDDHHHVVPEACQSQQRGCKGAPAEHHHGRAPTPIVEPNRLNLSERLGQPMIRLLADERRRASDLLGCFSWPPSVSSCENASVPGDAEPLPTKSNDARGVQHLVPAATTGAVEDDAKTALAVLSWWHMALYRAALMRSLPLPRRVGPNDPDLVLTRSQKNQRRRDEKRARQLQGQLVQLLQQRQHHQQQLQSHAPNNLELIDQQVAQLVQELYGVLYGDGVTPQSRQSFLERYGCTGWTDRAIEAVLRRALGSVASGSTEMHHSRGLVEIGAGHGQWARHITDRYKDMASTMNHERMQPLKPFEIVLAYDDASSLPLNSAVYHRRTQPYHDYFYDRVQPCPSIGAVLSQWQCRGRVLLLVYPPPDSDMARDALDAYVSVDGDSTSYNDTFIYVGEGRGGANANDAFFDVLESGKWILEEIVEVLPIGSKGYERMYIFTRSQPNSVDRSAPG